MPLKDRHFKRQRAALDRLVKLNATFEGAWFDRKGTVPNGDFVTGILSEIYYQTKQGRRPKGERPASYAVFTDNFHQSLKNGNLINIDLELLSTFRSPTAALNFRHLNKVWHSGRKPEHYSCDLRDLACGRLHMTDSRNLKTNYSKVPAIFGSEKMVLLPRDIQEPNSLILGSVLLDHIVVDKSIDCMCQSTIFLAPRVF